MIEIITRRDGEPSEKKQINGHKAQVSYNSDGHICIRAIEGDGKDTLVVLGFHSSVQLINFVKKITSEPIFDFILKQRRFDNLPY